MSEAELAMRRVRGSARIWGLIHSFPYFHHTSSYHWGSKRFCLWKYRDYNWNWPIEIYHTTVDLANMPSPLWESGVISRGFFTSKIGSLTPNYNQWQDTVKETCLLIYFKSPPIASCRDREFFCHVTLLVLDYFKAALNKRLDQEAQDGLAEPRSLQFALETVEWWSQATSERLN
jgi:hypothetical protein